MKPFFPTWLQALNWPSDKSMSAGQTAQSLEFMKEAVNVRRGRGDELSPAMALFKLTFVQSAAGDLYYSMPTRLLRRPRNLRGPLAIDPKVALC